MAYHSWLSSTPRFHLTSSAPVAFSIPMPIKTRHRPEPAVSYMEMHTDDQWLQPTLPPQLDHRTSASILNPSEQAPAHNIADFVSDYTLAGSQPITPPWQPSDAPPFTNRYVENCELRESDTGDKGLTRMSHGQNSRPVPQVNTIRDLHRRPRDDRQENNMIVTDAQRFETQKRLPSPPDTPQCGIELASPQSPSSPQPQRMDLRWNDPRGEPYLVHTDPMLQTSTDPHYWSTNCTVLKADSCMNPGNVISPTCMVGLPFGGMVEMMLPLPKGEISGQSDFE